MTIVRRRLPVLALVLCLGGCVSSSTAYDSEFFQQPPEIWEKDGAYHVRVYELKGDVVGYSIASAEKHENDVHVWLWPRHSSGSNPNRLLPLNIPIAAGAPPNFLWKDPDGSLHPIKLRRS